MKSNKLKIVISVLAVILVLLVLAFFIVNGLTKKSSTVQEYRSPSKTPESSLAAQPEPVAPQVKPALQERYITNSHKIKQKESISLITQQYWQDMHLWPDLYDLNKPNIRSKGQDPDLIYPDDKFDIYNRLGNGNNFSQSERERLGEVYLEVYQTYKALGENKKNARWSALYRATTYEPDFLTKYANFISAEDLAMVEKYKKESTKMR